MVPSSFAVPNSNTSGFGDLHPFAAMTVSMPATLAASAGVATSLAPPPGCFQFPSLLWEGGWPRCLGARCVVSLTLDPRQQLPRLWLSSLSTLSGNTLLMPFEGCDAGAVAGISLFFLVCAVVDGAKSIFEFDLVMDGAAAAKHKFDSEFKQAKARQQLVVLQRRQPRFVVCSVSWMVRS